MRIAVIYTLAASCEAFVMHPVVWPQLPVRPFLSAVSVQAGVPEFLDAAQPLLTDAVTTGQTEEAIRAAAGELGWWGSYIKLVEDGIMTLHDQLVQREIPYPYGLSIFAFVLGVKFVTLPLNWNQLSSAASMKAIKPQQDLVKKWYGDNKQLESGAIGNLFEALEVNPLAGCLPSIAQIPVFLGVYYSVTAIAKAKIYTEGFLWIPSLSGPIADRREGISWLTSGWIDGMPRLGWHDTLCYLTIPIILVCSQTLSLYLLGSFEALGEDEQSKTAATVLRFLPVMIGWFAMNAPSGLGLYWVFNNILTTATTVTVKKLVEKPILDVKGLDIAALGPRRDALPLPAAVAPDWVPQAPPSDDGNADGKQPVAVDADADTEQNTDLTTTDSSV